MSNRTASAVNLVILGGFSELGETMAMVKSQTMDGARGMSYLLVWSSGGLVAAYLYPAVLVRMVRCYKYVLQLR